VKAYLLVHIQLAEDLGRIQEMGIINDPISIVSLSHEIANSASHALVT